MSAKDDLINPIIFYPIYTCEKCGGRINILTTERTLSMIDEEGHPLRCGSMIRIDGVCSKCGNSIPFNYDATTMTYYKDTPFNNAMAQINQENSAKLIRHYNDECLVKPD